MIEESAYVVTSKRRGSPCFHKSLLEIPNGRYGDPEMLRAEVFGYLTVFSTRENAEEALKRVPNPEFWEIRPIVMYFDEES